MDTFKTMEGERIEQLERDKVALMAEIQDLKRQIRNSDSVMVQIKSEECPTYVEVSGQLLYATGLYMKVVQPPNRKKVEK